MNALPAVLLSMFAGSWAACETAAPGRRPSAPPRPNAPATAPSANLPLEEQVRRLSASSRPGEKHAALAPLVGDWDVALSNVSLEGRETEPFRGSAKLEWVLGGRFLRWDAQIDFAGSSGATTGYLGYDLRGGEYQLMMISDLATGMEVARGGGELKGAGLVFALEQIDPRSGARLRAKSRLRLLASDHFVLEQLETTPEGGERAARVWHYRRTSVPTR